METTGVSESRRGSPGVGAARGAGWRCRARPATKADLDSLETRLNTRIDARFSSLETRMLRVAIAIVLAQMALTAALTTGLTFGLLEMFGCA